MILMNLAFVLPWLLLAAGSWLAYQFLLQHGRILLRLESLEEHLQQVASRPVAAPAPAPAARPEGLPIGSPAPDFILPDLAGKPTSLSGFGGERILLVFFNLKCGFCQSMAPTLKTFTSGHAGEGPHIVVVSTGDPAENQEFFRTHGIECPVLLQKEMEIASRFRVQGTPMGYVVDEQGRVASELAAGEPGIFALLGMPAPGSPGSAYGPQNGAASGAKNGRPTAIGKGNRSLEDSHLNRSGLKAGTAAPLFNLPRVGHCEEPETLSLESFRGQPVLLIFSDPNCGPCNDLAVKLEQRWREAPSVPILMVSRGDLEENRTKIAGQQLTFPVVLQKQWEVSKLYGMFATPIAYLIDEQGVIAVDVAVGIEPILRLFAGAETTAVQMIAV